MINFYLKQCLSAITWNKKHLSKLYVPITCALEKRFFAVAILLKVCESFLFGQSRKTSSFFRLHEFSLDI